MLHVSQAGFFVAESVCGVDGHSLSTHLLKDIWVVASLLIQVMHELSSRSDVQMYRSTEGHTAPLCSFSFVTCSPGLTGLVVPFSWLRSVHQSLYPPPGLYPP